jgi:hypothetical protein
MEDVRKIDGIEQAKTDKMREAMNICREHAERRGLCLVQLSARRYIVTRVSVYGFGTDGELSFLTTNVFGSAVFGPSTRSACMEFLKGTARKELDTRAAEQAGAEAAACILAAESERKKPDPDGYTGPVPADFVPE